MLANKNSFLQKEADFDLLVVKIVNPNFRYDSFEYMIYSSDEKIFRKGSFRAPSVQLRTIDMQEGTWHIRLLYNGKEWKTGHFEKQKKEEKRKANVVYFL